MAVISNNILAGASGQAGGAAGYQIERSLRFNSGDSSRLSISPSSTNRKTWTWSGWVKRSKLGGYDRLFGAETSSTAVTTIRFTALAGYEDCLEFHHTDGTNVSTVTTAAKLRDLSAWYHITVVVDTTQVLPANRTKIYINGIKQALSSTSYLNQDVLTFINSGNTTNIGRSGHYGAYFDGYLAEVNFLDGLTPGTATDDSDGSVSGIPDAEYLTDFGEFDADTGVWNPIEYTGSYPGNSFYLKFDDTSTTTSIGQDSSGNGNNFTATNITVLGLPAPESDVITGVSQYTTPTYSDANNFTSTGSTSWTPPSGQRTGLFNIAGNAGLASYDPNQTIVWTPSTGIPCTTLELVIYDGQKSTGPMAVNGTYDIRPYVAQSQTGFSWVNIPNPPSTLTSITFSGGTGGVGWYGIRVNGVKLIDNNTVATLTLASNQNLAKFNVGDTVRQDNGVDYLAGTTADNGDATSSLYDGLVDTNTSTYIRPTTTMYFSNLPQASTSLRIYCWAQNGNQGNMVINGSDSGVSAGNGSWNWVTLNSLCPITMTSLSTVSGNVADGLFISAIEIDGSIVRSPSIGGTAAVIDTSANTITVSQSAGTWSANTSNYVVGPSTLNTSSDLDTLFDSPTNGTGTDSGLGGELSGNYCTWNPLKLNTNGALANGNLDWSSSTSGGMCAGTIGVSSDKWYWEVTVSGGTNCGIGVFDPSDPLTTYIAGTTVKGIGYYGSAGSIFYYGGSAAYGNTFGPGDVIGVALDLDNGKIYFSKNGTWQNSGDPAAQTNPARTGLSGVYAPAIDAGASNAHSASLNTGQRPFQSTAPSGFKSLCTANLPTPDIKDGSTAFDVVTWTGDSNTNSTRSFSSLSFSPEFVWMKDRSQANQHTLYDTVRGASNGTTSKALMTNSTGAEGSLNDDSTYGYLSSFDANGFSVWRGTDGAYTNRTGNGYVAWTWDAGTPPTRTHTQPAFYSSSTLYTTAADVVANATARSSGDSITNEYVYIVTNSGGRIGESVFSANGTLTSTWYMLLREGASWVNYGSYNNSTDVALFKWRQDFVANRSTYTCANNVELHLISSGSTPAQISVTLPTLATTTDDGAVANTNGTIESRCRANTTTGFSIVSYTGTAITGSVGHGLGVKPSFYIVKRRNAAEDWFCHHQSHPAQATSPGSFIKLNFTEPGGTAASVWNNTDPSPSVISLGTNTGVNGDSSDYIAYCWAPVEGYSAFGSYTGSTNLPFVFCGFRPKFLLIKNSSLAGSNWVVIDSSRNSYNEADLLLKPNVPNIEQTTTANKIDVLSNGFKCRGTDGDTNGSGNTMIYMAMAESPFKYARAR